MKNTKKRLLLVATVLGVLGGSWMVVYAATAPTGPYTKSCTKCSVNGKNNTLYCTCQTADHKSNQTSLWLKNCTASINNCNGSLHCGDCP